MGFILKMNSMWHGKIDAYTKGSDKMKIKSSYLNNELIEFINDRDEEENVNIENNNYYVIVDAL